ncbi:hypothetical protein ABT059_19870 [Micromonospora tulbaghiae]
MTAAAAGAQSARTPAAAVRDKGSATAPQRAELRALIARKAVTDEWKNQFYADVIADDGLSEARASGALRYLRNLADRAEQPVYATAEQEQQIRELVRTRVAPAPWRHTHMVLLETGTLPYIKADQFIDALLRLPMRKLIPPDGPVAAAGNFPDGYYAIRTTAGEVEKYRVVDKGGLREVWKITKPGSGRRTRIRGRQAVDVIACIGADPAAASRLWAEVTKRCSACNTDISPDADNLGFPHGFGPKCWRDREALRLNRDARAAIADEHPEEPAA